MGSSDLILTPIPLPVRNDSTRLSRENMNSESLGRERGGCRGMKEGVRPPLLLLYSHFSFPRDSLFMFSLESLCSRS